MEMLLKKLGKKRFYQRVAAEVKKEIKKRRMKINRTKTIHSNFK